MSLPSLSADLSDQQHQPQSTTINTNFSHPSLSSQHQEGNGSFSAHTPQHELTPSSSSSSSSSSSLQPSQQQSTIMNGNFSFQGGDDLHTGSGDEPLQMPMADIYLNEAKDAPPLPSFSQRHAPSISSDDISQPWFLRNCNRSLSINLLKGKEAGTFLIRPSSSKMGYSLSYVRPSGSPDHILIFPKFSGFSVNESGEPWYDSLTSLVSALRPQYSLSLPVDISDQAKKQTSQLMEQEEVNGLMEWVEKWTVERLTWHYSLVLSQDLHPPFITFNLILGVTNAQGGEVQEERTTILLDDYTFVSSRLLPFPTPHVARALAFCSNLRSLTINGVYHEQRGPFFKPVLVDSMMIDLGKGLKANRTLEVLDLSKNGLTDEGALEIADALFCNRTITNVNLNYNSIQGEGLLKLVRVFGWNEDGLMTKYTNFSVNHQFGRNRSPLSTHFSAKMKEIVSQSLGRRKDADPFSERPIVYGFLTHEMAEYLLLQQLNSSTTNVSPPQPFQFGSQKFQGSHSLNGREDEKQRSRFVVYLHPGHCGSVFIALLASQSEIAQQSTSKEEERDDEPLPSDSDHLFVHIKLQRVRAGFVIERIRYPGKKEKDNKRRKREKEGKEERERNGPQEYLAGALIRYLPTLAEWCLWKIKGEQFDIKKNEKHSPKQQQITPGFPSSIQTSPTKGQLEKSPQKLSNVEPLDLASGSVDYDDVEHWDKGEEEEGGYSAFDELLVRPAEEILWRPLLFLPATLCSRHSFYELPLSNLHYHIPSKEGITFSFGSNDPSDFTIGVCKCNCRINGVCKCKCKHNFPQQQQQQQPTIRTPNKLEEGGLYSTLKSLILCLSRTFYGAQPLSLKSDGQTLF